MAKYILFITKLAKFCQIWSHCIQLRIHFFVRKCHREKERENVSESKHSHDWGQ